MKRVLGKYVLTVVSAWTRERFIFCFHHSSSFLEALYVDN